MTICSGTTIRCRKGLVRRAGVGERALTEVRVAGCYDRGVSEYSGSRSDEGGWERAVTGTLSSGGRWSRGHAIEPQVEQHAALWPVKGGATENGSSR